MAIRTYRPYTPSIRYRTTIVNDGERLARPRERNDVGWHEQQVRMGARQGQRKAHLRPQARERDDGEAGIVAPLAETFFGS